MPRKAGNFVQFSVRVDKDTAARLNQIAVDNRIQVAIVVRLILEGASLMLNPAVIECGNCERTCLVDQKPFRFCPYCGHRLGDDPPFGIRAL